MEFAKARDLTRAVLPLDAGLDDIPALPVNPDQARLLRQGQMLFGTPAAPGLLLARHGETPVALVESDGTAIKVVRGFNI
jgi:tRNA pseudouridine55 synthase